MDVPQISEILLTEDQITDRVRELAAEISRDYAGKEILAVGILKGAFMFLADLARNITVPLAIEFITLSSYGSSTESNGDVKMFKDIYADIKGKHILLVEDIVDTGWTLSVSDIVSSLLSRGAESVRVCALLDKPSRRQASIDIHYVGFTIPDEFVVGYGLDLGERYRNLRSIYKLDTDA